MGQRSEFFSSLEGIRGYAFLLVFFIHYTNIANRPTKLSLYPLFLLNHTAWFLVPIFFTLSGFLITRILLKTRDREGYFRVFYLRRFLRIFPVYYLTLFALAAVVFLNHWKFHRNWLLYLVYLQNLSYPVLSGDPHIVTGHLWSLALEEQFYLIWPVVIWFLRGGKPLLYFSYCFIGVCFLVRFAWPLLHVSYLTAYYFSFARADAIVMGAVLAILYEQGTHWHRLNSPAKVLIPVIWLAVVAVVLVRGNGNVTDYVGVAAMIPAQNLIGACFVVLALNPKSWVARLCTNNFICRVGRMSYGLYIFHLLYRDALYQSVGLWLTYFMPSWLAMTASALLALLITFVLAAVVYRFIEEPLLGWKEKIKYGERKLRPIASVAERLPSTLETAV